MIAIVTAAAYWITFRYEIGYLSAYGFSPDFVEVSFQATLLVAFALSGIVITLVWFFILMSPDDPPKRRRTIPFMFIFLSVAWYLLVYEFDTEHISILLGMIAGCSIWWALSYLDEVLTKAREKHGIELVTSMDRLTRFFSREPVFLLGTFIGLSALAQFTGRGHAETKKDYLILADLPKHAVVRIYTDKILAVQVDRTTKKILPNTLIPKIEKDSIFQLEKLGPLKKG